MNKNKLDRISINFRKKLYEVDELNESLKSNIAKVWSTEKIMENDITEFLLLVYDASGEEGFNDIINSFEKSISKAKNIIKKY